MTAFNFAGAVDSICFAYCRRIAGRYNTAAIVFEDVATRTVLATRAADDVGE